MTGTSPTGSSPTGSALLAPTLYAVSDLHVGYAENRSLVESALRPTSPDDWLIVAGDVAEVASEVTEALALLAGRFARVIWTPGNHELWTPRDDPDRRCGQERYDHLVATCRSLGVLTPEDPYPLWSGPGGPVRVAPLFVPYDYSWRAPGTRTTEESLAYAHRTGIVCTDEFLLDPTPFARIDAWCAERVRLTEERLTACGRDVPLVLVNHFPLVREPTLVLRHPEFAQWCGTVRTADWHRRFPVVAVVYGHLHIPRTTHYDGVRFEEVSLGYPRERREYPRTRPVLRQILPPPGDPPVEIARWSG
jgi:3',5'-cyclic AMP phosphodiesterase CpdA